MKITKNEIIRHIARMPYYQVHYTQKSIRASYDKIPETSKSTAREMCEKEIARFGRIL